MYTFLAVSAPQFMQIWDRRFKGKDENSLFSVKNRKKKEDICDFLLCANWKLFNHLSITGKTEEEIESVTDKTTLLSILSFGWGGSNDM